MLYKQSTAAICTYNSQWRALDSHGDLPFLTGLDSPEHPRGVWKVMCSIPMRDTDFFSFFFTTSNKSLLLVVFQTILILLLLVAYVFHCPYGAQKIFYTVNE